MSVSPSPWRLRRNKSKSKKVETRAADALRKTQSFSCWSESRSPQTTPAAMVINVPKSRAAIGANPCLLAKAPRRNLMPGKSSNALLIARPITASSIPVRAASIAPIVLSIPVNAEGSPVFATSIGRRNAAMNTRARTMTSGKRNTHSRPQNPRPSCSIQLCRGRRYLSHAFNCFSAWRIVGNQRWQRTARM